MSIRGGNFEHMKSGAVICIAAIHVEIDIPELEKIVQRQREVASARRRIAASKTGRLNQLIAKADSSI